MGYRLPNILTAAALLTIAACEETMTTTVITPALPPPVPSAPALPTYEPVDIQTLGADPVSGLPDPSVATCMSEVARASGSSVVAPLSVDEGLTGQTVVIGVGEARAPWECRVDASGDVSVSPGGA